MAKGDYIVFIDADDYVSETYLANLLSAISNDSDLAVSFAIECNAFNEGTRLVHCLKMHNRLFGVEAKKVGGDTDYAGTENRDYCKANGIQTSFVKRGRPFGEKKKEKDLVRKELARVRATAMEGSFGTQKEHYDLRRVKARTKRTEILYIVFGIHTANVVQLADRIEQRARLAAA